MLPSRCLVFAAAGLGAMLPALAARADGPDVVASIKPLHSLVAGVMGDVGTPHLIVTGGDEPHTYALRPSDADALARADIVFWIGENFETFLNKPIANLAGGQRSVPLTKAPGLVLHEYGEDGDHEHEHEHEHADDDHEHEHADDHDHDGEEHADDHDHDHDADEQHAEGHDHDGHGHVHTGLDGHIWLDPQNARAMVKAIAAALTEADPAHADAYAANAAALDERLAALDESIAARLAPWRDVPYYTFHDAFRYFDEHFGLSGRGAITVSPELQPGAQRLAEIRAVIGADERACVFAEPLFPPRLVDIIVEGTNARTGVLDDLGSTLEAGPDQYFQMMESNADAFAACFQSTQ